MSSLSSLNKNNSAVKRIMQEARELANDPCTDYSAAPLEDDIFEWHCTLRGPAGTEFEGGLYHFRILLPAEYPFRPPSLMMLTPNGRFELNTKICISFTSYHEEMWQPAWGVRTAILGLQGFFPLKGQAAVGVGSIEYPVAERKRLTALSQDWVCPYCNRPNMELLPEPQTPAGTTVESSSVLEDPGLTVEQSRLIPDGGSFVLSDSPSSLLNNAPTPNSSSEQLMHNVDTLMSPHSTNSASPLIPLVNPHPVDAPVDTGHFVRVHHVTSRRRGTKPPLLLDTVICVLLVLVFSLIFRRMF